MKGQFKNIKELNKFIGPIKIISAIVGESGFNVEFTKNEDGDIVAVIPARNKTQGVHVIHEWSELFKDFEIDEDKVRIGFMNASDLIGRLSIFDDDEINVEMHDTGIMSFQQKRVKLEFKTSDPELIVEAKRNFSAEDLVGEFEMGDDTDKIRSALKVMNSEELISFTGVEEKGKIKVVIYNNGMKTNAFKYIINATVHSDFNVNFKRDLFPVILSTKGATSIKFNIAKRYVNVVVKTDYSETNYFIGRAIVR